jgi:molybdopterin molybdotransferase
MLSVDDARNLLLGELTQLGEEKIALDQAAGRILARDIIARMDLPPFSNSSMDGFAVIAHDLRGAGSKNPIRLTVVGDIAAGRQSDHTVGPGQTMRIMTGAPLPDGADAVVPVEDTDFGVRQVGVSAPETVRIFRPVGPGAYIRSAGEDLVSGSTVLPKGQRLRPQDIAMLASLGQAEVWVRRKPVVAILSTGDELLPVEADLTPGKIRESNAYALAVQLASCGAVPVRLGIVADNADAVEEHLELARSKSVDMIISSAGVSVGAFDYVRDVVEAKGDLLFWRVNMRPGKPLAVGRYHQIPFVGLPGNPVSAYIGYEVFLRPAIYKMAGDLQWRREVRRGVLTEDIKSDGRESYLRGQVYQEKGVDKLRLTGHQGSGNLFSLVQASALIVVPAGVNSLPAGADVNYWPL